MSEEGIRVSQECVIRRARRSDLRDIYLVEVKSFPYPYPMEAFITFLVLYPKYFFVAECGNRVVGYVTGVMEEDGSGHVMSLAVLPSHRRRGLGSALLKVLEEAFLRDGVKRIYLEVSQSNKEGIRLYRRFGYKMVGAKQKYYPDGSDAYVMVKEIHT